MLKWALGFLGTALLFFYLFYPQARDSVAFQNILSQHGMQERVDAHGLLSYCEQFREGVNKEILYCDGDPRKISISSPRSELFFFRSGSKLEVIEELENVHCMIQERLDYQPDGTPYQKVYTLDSSHASYNYSTHTLTAAHAKICRYTLPGHTVTSTYPSLPPTTVAEAKQAHLILDQGQCHLQAKGLRLQCETD